ncbi:hypothetical protein [Corallococcus sp. 4LFB]|uniref:hypothetical protein n=1 Tax=Corallococcus sp. 4LFB TaxID=3383249 RepID=UPI00397674F6
MAEALYATMEEGRAEECKRTGVDYVAEGWAPARVNKALGDFAKLEGDAAKRFQDTWDAYLDAPENAARSPPYSLSFFLASRSTWESKALQAAAEASP